MKGLGRSGSLTKVVAAPSGYGTKDVDPVFPKHV
jgi:hypothetical protein